MIIGTLTVLGQQRIRKHIADYAAHTLTIAWGICKTTDTALETDTALVKELGRKAATVAVSGDELTISCSQLISAPIEVLEVGIYSTGGYLCYRGLLSDDSATAKTRYVAAGDTLTFSIVFDFANGAFV